MAGKIIADTLEHSTAGSVTTDYVVSGTAKAWVNFNGTGTVAIRESFSTSSMTDVGTGIYDINFSTAMTDANYSAGGMCNYNINGWGTVTLYATNAQNPFTTTSMSFRTLEYASSFDPAFVNVQVFR